MPLLEVKSISKSNERGPVLAAITFHQNAGQNIAIAGETGSGKSTLLRIISGLIQAGDGTVLFNGTGVKGPEEKLIPGHPGIAYLSQQYELRNHYRVAELMDMANHLTDKAATTVYELCRVTHLLQRRTDQLSGGEKQRIALARLLVTAPQLLVLDEPFSNLDLIHKSILKSVLYDVQQRLGVTMLLASHDPVDTLSWADELIILKNGTIVQGGTPQAIYHQPADEYVAGLLGSYNLLTDGLAKAFGIVATGEQIMVRPEQFGIITTEAGNVKGIVQEVHFYGSYYEVKVAVGADNILIKTGNENLHIGDAVFVALQPDAVWAFE